jgi:hypothetical protein
MVDILTATRLLHTCNFSVILIQILTRPLRAQNFSGFQVRISEILLAFSLFLIHIAILLLQTYDTTVLVRQVLTVLCYVRV